VKCSNWQWNTPKEASALLQMNEGTGCAELKKQLRVADRNLRGDDPTTAASVIANAKSALGDEVDRMDEEMEECRKTNQLVLTKELKHAKDDQASGAAEARTAMAQSIKVATAAYARATTAQAALKKEASDTYLTAIQAHEVAAKSKGAAARELEASLVAKTNAEMEASTAAAAADVALAKAKVRHAKAFESAKTTAVAVHKEALAEVNSNAQGKLADAKRVCEQNRAMQHVALLMKAKGFALSGSSKQIK